MKRTLALCAVIVCALVAALAATRARRLGLRVDSFATEPAADADDAPNLGDDLPFEPQRFAFVENVLGDDLALEESMDKVAQFGGADVVILLGNVLGSGTESEARRLVAACRDRGSEVIAVPSPNDMAHGDVFGRWFGPSRWWFMRRGCVYVGVPGRGTEDDRFVRAALVAAPPDSRAFVFTAGRVGAMVPEGALFAPRLRDRSQAGVTVHIVGADDDSGGEMAAGWGPRMFGASPWRFVALDLLWPIVQSPVGYSAFLGICAIAAALAIGRLIRSRAVGDVTPRGASV